MASATLKERPADDALYDRDFYTWTLAQAAALRERHSPGLDWERLAEEIEDLGRSIQKQLESSFRVILIHMLKWDHQPERRSRGWTTSIRTHRNDIRHVLADNPSLRRRQMSAVTRAYENARIEAATQMRRREAALPETCPYTLDDILTREFPWPEA